jgi:hypothetical protein
MRLNLYTRKMSSYGVLKRRGRTRWLSEEGEFNGVIELNVTVPVEVQRVDLRL